MVAPVAAHPHVFIESTTKILMNENHEISGFRHFWKFDDQYTAFALVGMDVNKDGVYSSKELEPLARENMESLHEFGFFTFASQNSKKQSFKSPSNYVLKYDEKVLTLEFTLLLETPIKALANPVKFSIYDPEFFIAFLEPKNQKPVQLASTAPKNCLFEKQLPKMDQTNLVESRLGQTPDFTNEENKGAGSLFSPTFVVSCLAN